MSVVVDVDAVVDTAKVSTSRSLQTASAAIDYSNSKHPATSFPYFADKRIDPNDPDLKYKLPLLCLFL
jgi:hypothetical protein